MPFTAKWMKCFWKCNGIFRRMNRTISQMFRSPDQKKSNTLLVSEKSRELRPLFQRNNQMSQNVPHWDNCLGIQCAKHNVIHWQPNATPCSQKTVNFASKNGNHTQMIWGPQCTHTCTKFSHRGLSARHLDKQNKPHSFLWQNCRSLMT